MHSLLWWTIWGLIVGIGLFGLRESARTSLHLILAIPLLSGALAAAALRLRHEYHEAVQHAKWVGITSVLLLLGTGYLYVRTEAFGPFATGSRVKAFAGATFEMSVPEVERALGKKLSAAPGERSDPEGLRDWVIAFLPLFERPSEVRTLEVVAYGIPGESQFDFLHGRLGKVRLSFSRIAKGDAGALVQRIREELEKSYKPVSVGAPMAPMVYRKDAVEAVVTDSAVDSSRDDVQVTLRYLPFDQKDLGPLTVNAQTF